MKDLSDRILGPLIHFTHERIGLSPNQVSFGGFIIGLLAAAVVALGHVLAGLLLMALSQIIDGVDGGIARRYNLRTRKGVYLEAVYDRLNELTMFLALAYTGMVSFTMALLAFLAIILVTIVEPTSKFDPGAKRFMLYFGWLAEVAFGIRGFELSLHVVFFVNLTAVAVGTVIVDYRLQKEVDARAIAEREHHRALGLPLPPEDPPSILSKLFSWL
jgi:phosphatidylglycerophosphate synthase